MVRLANVFHIFYKFFLMTTRTPTKEVGALVGKKENLQFDLCINGSRW